MILCQSKNFSQLDTMKSKTLVLTVRVILNSTKNTHTEKK